MFRKGRRALLLTPCFQNIYKEFRFRAQKREQSERHLFQSDWRSKFNLIKVSKSASEMSISGRPQNDKKAKVHNFFHIFHEKIEIEVENETFKKQDAYLIFVLFWNSFDRR